MLCRLPRGQFGLANQLPTGRKYFKDFRVILSALDFPFLLLLLSWSQAWLSYTAIFKHNLSVLTLTQPHELFSIWIRNFGVCVLVL